ncbi:hypothetical protein OAU50_07115 [Planctomycetota bacterium]|nr:hypothetical protein [Planctomycetota bacterium]
MKKILLALAVFGMCSVPVFAQDGGDDGAGAEAPKSKEQLRAELIELMKKASEEMGEVERELAKASRDAPKADVVAERMKKLRESMESGKLEDLPEGLRKHLEENPDDVAELLGMSAEELKELAKDEAKLRETLEKNPEALKKLAESEDTMEKIIESQHAAEKKLAETLQRQEESAEKARKNVDDSLEVAHTLRKMQQSGQGKGEPKDNEAHTSDSKKKPGDQSGKGNEPKKGAEKQYDPETGEEIKIEEYERLEKSGFQTDGKKKETADAAGNDDNRKEPSKYKGFLEKWRRETYKKAESLKDAKKTPAKTPEKAPSEDNE